MTEKEWKENEEFSKKRANELTDELIEKISNCLVEISEKCDFLKHFYDTLGWDADACYTIEEGILKLGIGLSKLEVDKREEVSEE